MIRQAIITEKELEKNKKWLAKTDDLQEYFPYVGIRDTWKIGRRHLHLEPGTRRMHVSASDLERRAMTRLRHKFKDATFKTQVPSLPIGLTMEIANELDVIHPRDWEENAAKTMSTDIVMNGIDRQTLEPREIAVFIRYLNGLYNWVDGEAKPITREWQKISIAEIYHTKHQNQEFIILTDKQLSKYTEYSINWLNEYQPETYQEEDIVTFVSVFMDVFEKNSFLILNDLLEETATNINKTFSACLNLFRYCGTKHYLPLDIKRRITLSSTIGLAYDDLL
ncbi:MAG: hypothetical protein V7739_17255 [Motiliproteus sp.]